VATVTPCKKEKPERYGEKVALNNTRNKNASSLLCLCLTKLVLKGGTDCHCLKSGEPHQLQPELLIPLF
jgi:hypothetical protein